MTYCENCQSLEPKTKEIMVEVPDDDGLYITVCCDCGEETTTIPEQDDYDMER